MPQPTQPTPRERSRLAVSRLTKLLAGAAVAATAAFGVVVATGSRHGSTPSVDESSANVVSASTSDDGYDDYGEGFGLAPSQGVWSTSQSPSATSGGS